jgi:hypothetical protein
MLKVVAWIIVIFTGLFLWLKDEPHPSGNSAPQSVPVVAHCQVGTPFSGRFYVKGEDVNFRTGAGSQYSNVINQRASSILGHTEYRTLNPAYTLEGLCQTEEWLQARIAEVDGSPVDWGETGWIHKKFMTGEMSPERQAGLIWNIDGETSFSASEKAMLKSASLKILQDEPNCEEIIIGDRSPSRKGQYFVTCHSRRGQQPFNIWFSPEQVTSGANLAAPTVYPEAQAREACKHAIHADITHPSTLDLSRLAGYATTEHNNGNRTIIQDFTAKNSFGLELKHQARCLVLPDGTVELTITEVQ